MANPAVDFHRKKEVRACMRKRLSRLDSDERTKRSLEICLQLSKSLRKAKSLALFAPRSTEPDLDLLWHRNLLADVLRLYPRCVDNRLHLCAVNRLDQLQPGSFGVREPLGLAPSSVTPEFILVPGVAFTSDGKRLGNGCGYYDRFLSTWAKAPKKLGICFNFQLVKDLPQEPHDVLVDDVICA